MRQTGHFLAAFLVWSLVLCFTSLGVVSNTEDVHKNDRTHRGLQALYDFRESGGKTIHDQSGVGEPLELTIQNPGAVNHNSDSLEVTAKMLVVSSKPAKKLINAVRWSGELTIEAWIRPANQNQKGPARIVTLSKNGSQRNFTLGQDGKNYDVRLRTSSTSSNGIPSLNSKTNSLTTDITHVVYTRNRSGQARVYLNGDLTSEETISGGFANWDASAKFGLANEINGSRPWLGTYYFVAIYNRSLLPTEVKQHFKAGHQSQQQLAQSSTRDPEKLFTNEIAPIFVQHCFECHDSATQKGGFDVSRKDSVFAKGDSGHAVVAGDADKSLLIKMVENDAMPLLRDPLSDSQKQALRQWVNDGAVWPFDQIDASAYAHGGGSHDVWIQRLTVPEYIETVRSAVGVDISIEAAEFLPPDLRADGFSNTAYNLNVDLKHISAYSTLAEKIAAKMDVLQFAQQYSKSDKLTDNNMRSLIANMGKWLHRGPLDDQEIDLYRGVSTTVASAGGDFKEAVTRVIEAMLQSPRFIYRIENQRGDGTRWPVDSYALASRMSYILWGAPPDKQLMRAADKGQLHNRETIIEHVNRMLDDPRAVRRSTRFVSEWLNLNGLKNLRPNSETFPNWNPDLAEDMKRETQAFAEYVIWKLERPLSDLFNAQLTFLNARLAHHYGIEPTTLDKSKTDLVRYDLSDVPNRGGLLTQGSVLTKGGDEASMVTRGLFVLHDVLRGSVQDPPPCVDTTPVASKPGLTQRGVSEERIANPACGGCHIKFEPLAFGLETYDGLGTFHQTDEHGNALREDGEIFFPGQEKAVPYDTAAELMDHLSNSGRVKETLTWKMAQFALGRPLGVDDLPYIQSIHQHSQAKGGTYKALVAAIITSDLVRTAKTEVYP